MIDPDVLIGGLEPRAVVIVDYDERWPVRYEHERERLHAALGARAVAIEHVGSTSVPGLAAKPIVDILVTVEAMPGDAELAADLEHAGYALRVREPEHRMFRTPQHDVHVHVLCAADPEVARMLGFRDQLRHDAEARRRYVELKRGLAERRWRDLNEYAEAKGPFIEEVLRGLEHR